MSRFHSLFAALVSGLLFTGTALADTPKATVRASITIEGKTITLPHVRAFSTGMPYVLIYFTEKPLDGFKYGTGGNDSTWSGGQYGTVLRLSPALQSGDEGKPVVRYTIPEAKANEDDRVAVRSADVNHWQEQWLSQIGIKTTQLGKPRRVLHASFHGKANRRSAPGRWSSVCPWRKACCSVAETESGSPGRRMRATLPRIRWSASRMRRRTLWRRSNLPGSLGLSRGH